MSIKIEQWKAHIELRKEQLEILTEFIEEIRVHDPNRKIEMTISVNKDSNLVELRQETPEEEAKRIFAKVDSQTRG